MLALAAGSTSPPGGGPKKSVGLRQRAELSRKTSDKFEAEGSERGHGVDAGLEVMSDLLAHRGAVEVLASNRA
ncbi:hypothetical protein [Bradyrhizobium sp. WD16]|uniref:hypothetical protein n=1 Tax=Bradyrhizobium sp. WD16 TaxID=1521768 RepID=UPI0020A5F5DD|nr:hypothetical protein [Bradyrhizobium sp. WD16]